MTTNQALQAFAVRVLMLGGAAFGLSDEQLPPIVRAVLPLAAALVLAVETFAQHQTGQVNTTASIAAAQVAAQTAQAAAAARAADQAAQAPPAPLVVTDSLLQAIGAGLESARAGILATPAESGRHEAQPATALLPSPAFAGDDYPTQQIGVVRDVPALTIGV